MILWLFLGAAVALTLERTCYVWIARAPDAFRRWCARPAVARVGEPIAIVRRLFYGFKVLQLSVFVVWCYVLGGRSLVPAALAVGPLGAVGLLGGVGPLGAGGLLIVVGQALNWSVFYRLGAVGVFYGDRLGHEVPWCREFPFSVLSHPQYVGAVLSIWGFFLLMRFPHDDWIVLPALETLYYVLGTSLEGGVGGPRAVAASVGCPADYEPRAAVADRASAALSS